MRRFLVYWLSSLLSPASLIEVYPAKRPRSWKSLSSLPFIEHFNTEVLSDSNTVFHLLGNLPTELRLEIWKLSLPEPRTFASDTLYFLINNATRDFTSYRIPPACHVCLESASVVRNSHSESCHFEGTNPTAERIRIYYDLNHNINIIQLGNLERKLPYINPSIIRELIVDLRRYSPDALRRLDISWFIV
ncbi:uncharacterized protein RAG0_07860 [Rhynchosporium agropyri]|uniref:2EXR domain-containing protein n=1 Tax=Rhynchosporium agropyri TaxID=914238 RepID=A0A1E1KNB4_9HELO|nr:uncharacterized protein RAG0_07860 [Rhynchosporium agropyri]